ncbi:hypothetical protein [Nitratireductor indicus]|uniref:Alkaline proteinase inhibitor/ Outer membrane lipoprotein Omp19 domain-containing protein n=1 Tax=Nitratireductor indicus C115 TaxID=1231190 RepID=K2NQI0_9HYPH|nr:hypothetical protein [Nitratireductor indicus]EKF41605.1 hypothetical protein NA8A_15391 [Nitratireductor indicus C115]MDS1136133.1 hypothetical protein [Nitratireductor indicus]SFQ70382.1 hypothetical protein SAMN05216176_110141 [Nitratireductor indicus]
MKLRAIAPVAAAIFVAACQTTDSGSKLAESEAAVEAPPAASAPVATAFAPTATASPAQCAMRIAGPPPKPNKGSDFAANMGKNLARNVGRNVLANAIGGGRFGGSVAAQVVRTEQDLHGTWSFTDGSPQCGCEARVATGAGVVPVGFFRNSGYKLKDAKSGSIRPAGCSNPLLSQMASFALGYSFTGYDAELVIQTADGRGVGKLKRDGVDYFSGTLADGSPVVMWRR